MNLSTAVARENLLSLGTLLGKIPTLLFIVLITIKGKFSKTLKFKLQISALPVLAQSSTHKIWVKPNAEMPFLYGNHILKAHVAKISQDTPEHQGVVVYSASSDMPLGFGVTAKSSLDVSAKNMNPTAIAVFHQSDIGEYLRDEVSLV